MSDFFIQNQEEEQQNYSTNIETPTTQANSNFGDINSNIETFKQKKREHYTNVEEYGVELPDGYYDAFRPILENCKTQEERQETAYKLGTAAKYAELTGEPFLDAWNNVDAYSKANFPNLQNQKGIFEATRDMIAVGQNNVKLGNLGQQLMKAHRENDEELAASLMSEIDAINQRNSVLQEHIPDRWWKEAVEAGAPSIPFTGYVAGAGIIGNFLTPLAGTTASMATSAYLTGGQEYIDMIANGSTPQTARIVSNVSGILQGIVEADLGITSGIVKSSAKLMGKEAAEEAAKKSLKEIEKKVFKRFHFGPTKKLVANFAMNYAENVVGEGTEEFVQNIISVAGQDLAAILDDYDLPHDDVVKIVKDSMEQFKGGMLGAVFLGVAPSGLNMVADVAQYQKVKSKAETIASPEAFYNDIKDNPIFEGMSEENKKQTAYDIHSKVQQRLEERANAEAKKIAEIQDAAEGSEELKIDDEGEEVQATEVERDETGNLFTKDEVFQDEDGNETGGQFRFGEGSKGDQGARYGYIDWSWEEKEGGQKYIAINAFKMGKGREGIRAEAFNDFAIQHPGVDIEWNTKGSEATAVKEQLIKDNPSGKKHGLNYYADEDAIADAKTRKFVDKELDNNVWDVRIETDENGKEHVIKTKLTKQQRGAAIAILEAGAKRQGMSLTEYVNKTFGEHIFGTMDQFTEEAAAQGDSTKGKAGGVKVGLAQQGWKKYGQDVKAVIYAGKYADFSTWAHELAHIFQNQLDGKLKQEAEAAFNVVKGDWEHSMYTFKDGRVMPAAEAFAYGFQDWLKTGKADNEQMKNIFQKFAEFIARAYNSLADFIDLNPKITSVYEQLLSGDDSLLKAAEMAVEAEDRRYRAEMKRQQQEAETKKQAEAEQQQKAEEAERDENSEITEYEEEKEELTPEAAEEKLQEATSETEEKNNAIDDALENTNLTDDQKTEIADVLNDETTTVEEKAEAGTDAASSAYIPYDLFQTEAGMRMQYQLANETSILRMTEGEERDRILDALDNARLYEQKGYTAADVRRITGWERDYKGEWKYETDDSMNLIRGSSSIEDFLNKNPDVLIDTFNNQGWTLGQVLRSKELYEIFPYLKNIRVGFYKALDGQRSKIVDGGIMLNTTALNKANGPVSVKASLAYEIQKLIYALEYATNQEELNESIDQYMADYQHFYDEMQQALQDVSEGKDYDKASIDNHIQQYMIRDANTDAQIVAARILMNADARRNNTLAQTKAEIDAKNRQQQGVRFQNDADYQEAVKKAEELLFQNELTMYGIHNLSEDALRHAVKMGGLANPSMAVVDTEKNSFTNFGEVSLIPYNFMLEKGEGSKGTFGADIYSPRYPSIDKTVTETGHKKIHSLFHAIEDESYKNELEQKLVQKIENSSKQFDYAYSPLVMAYLAEKGNKDFYKYEKSEYSDEVKDLIKSLGASPNAAAVADNKVILEAYSKYLKKDYAEQIEKLQNELEELKAKPNAPEWIKKSRAKSIEKLQEDLDIANETIKELVDEKTGLFNINVADDFLYRVKHEIESAGKIDYIASEYAARELIENDPEFLPWAKEAYDRIEKEERIFNGFTPSGNRRYLAHTLENVSKYMKQQELQGGESFYYGLGSTRAKFTPNFKTLNQIKKARDRLVTSEEFEKIKEEYNERFDKITEALGDKYDPDVGAARFEEAFEYGKSDPIGYIEKEYGISVDDDMAQEILDFATALRVMPTEYFETKFTRPVELNEFAGAIIPSNLSQDLKNTLAEKGLMIEEYDREAGNREEVTKAALQKFNEIRRVLFQNIGEYGAENLDEAEGGTTRLDNLRTAKKMEEAGKDAKTIRLATAWEKGDDGKWRYELDDSKIKVENDFYPDKYFLNKYPRLRELEEKLRKDITAYNNFTDEERNDYDYYSSLLSQFVRNHIDFTDGKQIWKEPVELNDVMEAPELFKAYPQLEKVKFIVKNLEAGTQGQYDADTDTITLSPMAGKSTLLHEVQHAIQEIEGFAKGGNERQFDEISAEPLREKVSDLNKKMSEVLTEYVPLEDWLAIDQKLLEQNLSPEEYVQARIDAISKYDNGEYRKLAEEQQEIISRIEEIEENALEGQVEIDGRTYEDAYEAYRSLAGEVEARNVQTRMNFTTEQRLKTLLKETEDVAPEDKIILFQEVYHGSGADFDKFDTEQYGLSGEGSMSFGYGTYLTDDEEIARDYAERQVSQKYANVNDPYNVLKVNTLSTIRNEAELKGFKKALQERKDFLQHRIEDPQGIYSEEQKANSKKLLEELENLKEEDLKTRNLYTVEIPDEGYIVWDKPVRKQTADKIKHALFNEITTNPDSAYYNYYSNADLMKELDIVFSYMEGQQLYRNVSAYLEGDEKASKFLSKLGYAGIKYPAGTIHGNGKGAYNYVIFNDDDAKIVNHLFYQTEAELQDEALSFDNWQDFMEYCEAMHADDEVSPIPYNADAQWYQTFYETAKGIQTEQEKNEEKVTEKVTKEGALPGAMDALFMTFLKTNPKIIDQFVKAVADIDAMDLDSEEWQHVEDEEGAKQRERYDQLKDYIDITLSDYNWQTAIKRVQGGHEIAEGLRKRLLGEMTDSFKVRDFRALYSEIMDDEQFAVDEADSTIAQLNKKLSKYKKFDILKPNEDISRVSPERRKRIAEALQNKEIAEKIRNGSLKLDDEIEAYLRSLDKQVKDLQKDYNDLEKETKNDYQRLADAERRKLLKLHEELLLARSKLKTRDAETDRKIKKGLKITEKYQKQSQNLTANYDELFRKFTDLKNTMQITAEVQAALDRQEAVAGLKENLNNKQKEKNLIAEVKKMRIQLVKRTMRRVPFNRIDYENARTVIAIQRMLEPNLLGGVNRFIGIDSAYLRGVISGIVTDSEYKEKILNYLRKQDKSSQAFVDFLKKVEDLKSIKDFDSWTAKERKYAIKHLPKENWVRDLNLQQLAKEREESIDLDIGMKEKKVLRIDPKTGRAMEDKEGNPIYETAFVLDAADDLKKLVKDAVGTDMYDLIIDKPFAEWTTEELEKLAQRIDELYTEGRDMYAAKLEARKRENDALRKRVEDAIKETGITINDDDTPEEKERKAEKIAKILNQKAGLKGTEAGKESGIKAKFDRLIHGYADANVLRVSRILDNQSEGINVRLLYRMEDECFNNKTRSIMRRGNTVKKVMADNKITEGDLAEVVKVSSLGTEFTVDELLYFLAADKDYEIDERKVKPDADPLDMNDDYAATSRNAVMFGNMMSDNASQEQKEAWAQLDKEMQEAIENDTLTQEQKEALVIGQLDKRPGTTKFINYCKAKWATCLAVANNFLTEHPEYKALLEAIEADYAEQYERMNEISINEFNTPVHRVRAYVPLVRRESNGDTNVNQVKEDLLGAYGGEAGKQWVNKGMTQRRVNISPLNQKPVQTGLFRTWADSIDRTEHFIAYAPYVRQLNAVYKSRDASYTRRFIEARYGKPMLEYIDSYINEVANPNANKVRERGSEFLHILRGKTAPAYLGWKFSGIVKQGLTSPWPYMQFVNSAEYLAAATKCWTTGGKYYDAIKQKSAYMASRVMDPINELVDEMADNAKSKVDRAWSNFAKKGMAGLEWIDWTCVAPGWLACYEKEYNRQQNMSEARYQEKIAELTEKNMTAEIGTSEWMSREQIEAAAKQELMDDIETAAVTYADDCTRACQPSSRLTDLAPLFKNSSEAMKAFLQFQTSLNVIWQNIRYDIPYNIRQKEFKKIVGTVCGYIFAGIFMNSVMDGIGGDDDDDDMQALRNLVFYSTTQFTDAIPMIGSDITNMMDQLITGKRGFAQSGTDMTPSATKLMSALQKVQTGDFKKAAGLTAEGIGLGLGAPVSGTKEIYKLLGKPLSEGDVNIARGVSDVYGIAGDIIGE